MKKLLVVLFVCMCVVASCAEDIARVQKFEIWGALKQTDKMIFLSGFTNGLAARGRISLNCDDDQMLRRQMYKCIVASKELDFDQEIAMVDKYYKEHPEKWGEPVGFAIVDALTVSGGPCAASTPKLRQDGAGCPPLHHHS